MFKLCPYCQQQVPTYAWAAHEMQHQAPVRPAPPVAHAQSAAVPHPLQMAAAKAPRIYHHPRCGHATALPEATIYAQLQDPFSSTSDQGYCSGCKGYVASSELFWEGTSESVLSTDRRRKADFIRTHALNANDFVWDSTGPVRRKAKANWGAIAVLGVAGSLAIVLLGAVGLAIAVGIHAHRNAAARNNGAAPVVPVIAPPLERQMAGNPIGRPNPIEDVRIRQDDFFQQMRKEQDERHEQIMKDMQARMRVEIPKPPDFGPPPFPPTVTGLSGEDPIADARKRMEEIEQRSQQRLEEMRERSRKQQEEFRQRMNRRPGQLP